MNRGRKTRKVVPRILAMIFAIMVMTSTASACYVEGFVFCKGDGLPLEGVTVSAYWCNDINQTAGPGITNEDGFFSIHFNSSPPEGFILEFTIDGETIISECLILPKIDNVLRVDPIDLDVDCVPTCDDCGCRFTGGGVDTDGNWDHHTLEEGEMIRNGAGNLPEGIDRAQFGGQAGANTALPPQPAGEWTHHQQRGPSGRFTFHGGTASAPAGTEVDEIRCSDPGGCKHATQKR